MIDIARRHAKLGLPVFPIYPLQKSNGELVCSCSAGASCAAAGKHPRIREYANKATTDEAQIRAWWTRWPEAGVAMPTGEPSGVDVIDIDGEQGMATIAELQLHHGVLPSTLAVRTPRGLHVYFKRTGELRTGAGVLPGIDVRSDGGLVVLPGSPHRSGKTYEWEVDFSPDDVELADPPEWLVQELGCGERKRSEPLPEVIPSGQRNALLASLGGSMRQRNASESAILAALLAENERCDPPLPESEVRAIAGSVSRYEGGSAVIVHRGGNGTKSRPELEPGAFEPVFLESLPERHTRWILPGLLAEGGVTIIAGEPGSGKTTLAAELAWHVGSGESHWLGQPVKGRVCWLGFDDPADRIRTEKLELLGDLPASTFFTMPEPLPLSEVTLPAYIELLRERNARLLVVDTLLDLLNLADYDKSGPMQQGMALVRELAAQSGCCILATAHLSKDVTRLGVSRVANSTLLTAKADIVALLRSDHLTPNLARIEVCKDRLGAGNWSQKLVRAEGRATPIEGDTRPRTTAERVVAALEEHGGSMGRDELLLAVDKVSTRAVDKAIARLRDDDVVEVAHGEGFRAKYSLTHRAAECPAVSNHSIPSGSKGSKGSKPAQKTGPEVRSRVRTCSNPDPVGNQGFEPRFEPRFEPLQGKTERASNPLNPLNSPVEPSSNIADEPDFWEVPDDPPPANGLLDSCGNPKCKAAVELFDSDPQTYGYACPSCGHTGIVVRREYNAAERKTS